MKNSPNKGGRPALSKAQKQEYRITVRYDTAHNLKLRALARESRLPRTEVIRRLIVTGYVRERLRREHLEFMTQLKGIARNLNQLTRLANAKGLAAVINKHTAITAEIETLLKHLRDDR